MKFIENFKNFLYNFLFLLSDDNRDKFSLGVMLFLLMMSLSLMAISALTAGTIILSFSQVFHLIFMFLSILLINFLCKKLHQANIQNTNLLFNVNILKKYLQELKTQPQSNKEKIFGNLLRESIPSDLFTANIPAYLCCPITSTLMINPILAKDGNYYDLIPLAAYYHYKKSIRVKPTYPLNIDMDLENLIPENGDIDSLEIDKKKWLEVQDYKRYLQIKENLTDWKKSFQVAIVYGSYMALGCNLLLLSFGSGMISPLLWAFSFTSGVALYVRDAYATFQLVIIREKNEKLTSNSKPTINKTSSAFKNGNQSSNDCLIYLKSLLLQFNTQINKNRHEWYAGYKSGLEENSTDKPYFRLT